MYVPKALVWTGQILLLLFCTLFIPSIASAHEVYVLDHDEINNALTAPRSDFIPIIEQNLGLFIFSGVVALGLVVGVLLLSKMPFVERVFDPLLHKIKHFAPIITQFTFGLALTASGIYSAAFGPELPLSDSFGSFTHIVQALFVLLGVMIISGVFPRIAGSIALIIFLPLIFHYKTYMLNYGTYFGEVLALAFFGGGYSVFKIKQPAFEKNIERHLHKYKFLLLRVIFGVSLIYASVYAKYIHGGLAMETVLRYNLTDYFPFEAGFIVLGAFITELLIGLFFLIGFEIRFTSLVFIFFLIQSIFFFGEAVWPHIILIGTAMAMFTHGYDRYTIVAKFSRRKDLEPVI